MSDDKRDWFPKPQQSNQPKGDASKEQGQQPTEPVPHLPPGAMGDWAAV